MKYSDINKKFSDKVLEYMMNGYVINSSSMSGHQGEEGKVDLIKGEELIRVYLDRRSSYNWQDKNAWHGSIVYLRVGRWNRPAHECVDSWTTVWMQDLDIMEETKYYEVSDRGNRRWYVESEEEAIATQELRYSRWSNKSCQSSDSQYLEGREDIAAKYLKRVAGYHRIHRSKIKVKKQHSPYDPNPVYYIYYNGNAYLLQ